MIRLLPTMILSLAIGAAVLAGAWKLVSNEHAAALAELEAKNEEMGERLEAQRAMLDRLARSRRYAHVEIAGQRRSADGRVAETEVVFIELDERETELARQSFTIPGDVLFIDAWTVQFDPEDVATGHPLRGRTLVLLRRIYSDRIAPIDGFAIDTPGAVPPAYAGSDAGRYEQRIWEHFWDVATDAELATNMGVRVAQGVAVYKVVSDGDAFRLVVDDAGGMNLTPIPVSEQGMNARARVNG